ncbi:YggS family pyridoxal phosphate-dependent enzyme [Halobacillus naozhouensis]|uniref:Pyridoxal phosphate homeostasis protein n=1 Tax=Halobacillus naozhouensis TaxID=554880 RepID=A0ABY8J3K4_9BACI|nr:YggS family pyridoxal phosphate-dependent enzyme [Halobacillus naozhouensis]WFT76657.1 YggS family pyridoxal phosphate-dependent enzyme [Halobacillus naozhouensis]
MTVAENLTKMNKTIEQACRRSDRNPEEITIIAVTKYVSIERTKEALEAGITNLGENRKEGFLEKYESIEDQAAWHFIGTLQSRKVKDVIHKIDQLHSLDRRSLAKEINKRAEEPVSCFVQVNVSGEESKHGLPLEEVESFIEDMKAYDKVKVVGLMAMAPHIEEEEGLRAVFRKLRALRDRVRDKQLAHAPCEWLSMGMSNDYEIAIEEGATHIRVGSSLVG